MAVQRPPYIIDGVVIYNDRVIVPTLLRNVVLDALHAAHQDISSMRARARVTVFWTGMSKDIQKSRQSCQPCIKIAPSQPNIPVRISMPPSIPVEQIFADFLTMHVIITLSLEIDFQHGVMYLKNLTVQHRREQKA